MTFELRANHPNPHQSIPPVKDPHLYTIPFVESPLLEEERRSNGQRMLVSSETIPALYEEYSRPIFAYLYGMVGNVQDAQDLTQDVFIQTFVNVKDIPRFMNPKSWLYKVATYRGIDLLRSGRRRLVSPFAALEETLLAQEGEEEVFSLEETLSPRQSVFSHYDKNPLDILVAEENEQERILNKAKTAKEVGGVLRKMSDKYAWMLVLHYLCGIPSSEIARQVNITPDNARMLLMRSRQDFAKKYGQLH